MADYPHPEMTPELRAALDAIPKVKMRVYSHPSWGMTLIVKPGDDSIALENLSEDDDETLLSMEEVEMTQEDIDALPEFDG